MFFPRLRNFLMLLSHVLIVTVQIRLVVVVGVFVAWLQLRFLFGMVVTVAIELLTELHDSGVKDLYSFFVVFTLFLPDPFGLLLKVLFSLATLGVLLIRRLLKSHLISVKLSFLILVVVFRFRELLLLLQTRLLQCLSFLSQAFQHLPDIIGFLDRRLQLILPKVFQVFERLGVVLDFVLLWHVEFLVHLVLHLLAGEDPY